jgi:hypothetical protein
VPSFKVNEWLDCYAVVNGKFNDEVCERVPFKLMVKTRPNGGMAFYHEAITLEINKPSDTGYLTWRTVENDTVILSTYYRRLSVGMVITVESNVDEMQ